MVRLLKRDYQDMYDALPVKGLSLTDQGLLEPGEINHSESGRNSQLEITGNNHS